MAARPSDPSHGKHRRTPKPCFHRLAATRATLECRARTHFSIGGFGSARIDRWIRRTVQSLSATPIRSWRFLVLDVRTSAFRNHLGALPAFPIGLALCLDRGPAILRFAKRLAKLIVKSVPIHHSTGGLKPSSSRYSRESLSYISARFRIEILGLPSGPILPAAMSSSVILAVPSPHSESSFLRYIFSLKSRMNSGFQVGIFGLDRKSV